MLVKKVLDINSSESTKDLLDRTMEGDNRFFWLSATLKFRLAKCREEHLNADVTKILLEFYLKMVTAVISDNHDTCTIKKKRIITSCDHAMVYHKLHQYD